MKVLKGILKESLAYYRRIERDLLRRLKRLPPGSVKRRRIRGRIYYYAQHREGARVIHQYLGREKPVARIEAIRKRRALKKELALARAALKLLSKKAPKS